MCLYNIAIYLYSLLIRIGSCWIPKAKLWREGRKDIFSRMAEAITPNEALIWIHVASLGEFEQGRPLIEKIKAEHPKYKILLTFYSPSGYELRKNYQGADYIFYLPIDTRRNARKFLDIVKPEIAIFVKYEFWLNMLFELRRRAIKTYIVSAIFRHNSVFFSSYGSLWRRALKSFDTIFVQDQNSKELLATIGFNEVVVAGDTRFDRVAQIAQSAKHNPHIERFRGTTPLMIAGSTWPDDEIVIKPLIENNPGVKFVIAPHEIEEHRVQELQQFFKPFADESKGSPTKKWKKERSTLANSNQLCEWKMKELKTEIGTAEKIKKTLDEIRATEPTKQRVTNNDLDSR